MVIKFHYFVLLGADFIYHLICQKYQDVKTLVVL